MRTRDKVVVVLIVASLILGGLIFVAFQDNEVEANYSRWLFTTNLQNLLSSPAKFLSDELPSGTVFYGGLTIFAVVMTVVFLKMTRDGEIQALRRRLIDLRSEKHQTESLLQEEVWKGKHERQSKDSAMRDLETSIDKIETLLGELNEKEQELKARDVQLVSLKTSALGDSDSTPARPSSERLLREEINKKNEILQTKDSTIRELEQRLSAKTRLWESQLREKDGLLNGRNSELESLRVEISDLNGQLNDLTSAKKRAEDLLQEELRKKKEVLEANDGPSGLERARAEAPDVILLDVMMPALDGWRVAEQLLDDDSTQNIPIIFLTARAEFRDRARGLDIGGVDYVTKPFNPLELAGLVNDLLARIERGDRDELRAEKLSELRSLMNSE